MHGAYNTLANLYGYLNHSSYRVLLFQTYQIGLFYVRDLIHGACNTSAMLQCVGVCWSVLQCAAVCCSVLQCAAVCCSVLQCVAVCCSLLQCAAVCCSVLQSVAVCCSVLQCVAVCCSVLRVAYNTPAISYEFLNHSSHVNIAF